MHETLDYTIRINKYNEWQGYRNSIANYCGSK